MDELFSNVLYLIPVAFFIALRLISAKNKQAGNQQKKKSSGELVKKIHEAQTNPAYGKALTEAREVYIPSVASREAAPARQIKKPGEVKKAKKPAAPIPPKKSAFKSSFPETAPANIPQSTSTSGTVSARMEAKETSAATDLQALIARPGLTPLQQAVVWSEILGQPKGVL